MASKSKKASRRQPAPEVPQTWIGANWHWMALGIVLLAAAVVRIRLLSIPLERDEGEFAYMGQLMLQGVPPYKLAYNMKFPGIYAAYALMMAIFGETIVGVHLGLLAVNSISIVLVFLLGRRLIDRLAGIVAAAVFALISLTPGAQGTSAHATQYVTPFALGGVLLLLKAMETKRPITSFWSGLLFGMAILMKQQSVPFAAFAFVVIAWECIRAHDEERKAMAAGLGLLSLGVLIPFGMACLALYMAGVFPNFWFWTFKYAHAYVSEQTLALGWEHLVRAYRRLMEPTLLLWLTAVLGAVAIWFDSKAKRNAAFIAGFTIFSFAALAPGLFFRYHYFIVFLPAVGLLAGALVSWITRLISGQTRMAGVQAIPVILFLIIFCCTIAGQWDFFVTQTPVEDCRQIYTTNPFVEAIEIANYLKAHSKKDDLVAIIGSEPEILFYANRRTATGFIYMYSLVERQAYASAMQRQMMREVEQARPRYLIFVGIDLSWLRQPKSDPTVIKWAPKYILKYYEPVGLIDKVTPSVTNYYWGRDAGRYTPEAQDYIYVFERRPDR